MRAVTVVDLGMGNLRSVERALMQAATFAHVSCVVARTGDPDRVRYADLVVVPGQGAFRDGAIALAGGLGDALRAHIGAGKPYLGICLGLQVLFDQSNEAPGAKGLGVLRGRVVQLEASPGVKIPHMGWNRVELLRADAGALRAFDGEAPFFYFVHSFHAVPEDPFVVAAVTHHGPQRVTAAVHHENLLATQFHPEKSQETGLQLLATFLTA